MTSPLHHVRANPIRTVLVTVTGTLIATGLIVREQSLIYASELHPVQQQVSANHDLLIAVRCEMVVQRLRAERNQNPDAWSDNNQRDLEKAERQLEMAENQLFSSP